MKKIEIGIVSLFIFIVGIFIWEMFQFIKPVSNESVTNVQVTEANKPIMSIPNKEQKIDNKGMSLDEWNSERSRLFRIENEKKGLCERWPTIGYFDENGNGLHGYRIKERYPRATWVDTSDESRRNCEDYIEAEYEANMFRAKQPGLSNPKSQEEQAKRERDYALKLLQGRIKQWDDLRKDSY